MPDGALKLTISSRSASVQVVAASGAEVSVHGGSVVENPDGSLDIVADRSGTSRIVVRCPAGTDVVVGTATGQVETSGPLGSVRVVTGSGRVAVRQAASVEVRSASGRVHVTSCHGGCKVITRSGRVEVGRAGSVDVAVVSGKVRIDSAGAAAVHSVSGSVKVAGEEGARIRVRTMTGSVDVTLPPGAEPALSLHSTGGRVRRRLADGADGEVDVQTATGSIDVSER